jgi:hypothetical protein
MNCHDCQELLQRRLDGEAVTDAAAQHLESCAECRALFAAARRLEEGLRLLVPPAVPPGFAGRTVGRMVAVRRTRLRWRWAAAAALAASVLLGAWWIWDRTPAPPDNSSVVAEKPKDTPRTPPVAKGDADKKPVTPEPGLHDTLQQARTAMDQLTTRFWNKTLEQADVWRDVTVPLEMARLELNPKRTQGPAKVEAPRPGMTTGLQTVAAVTKRGISFMFHDGPPVPPAKTVK